ncbi:MAG: DUF4445 domain-containing protein [Desulfobacteraceae bacterium]|nr:MAG: DUF4445 domain-containing protein [Desulfobacteraceae bacterium]
MDRAQEETGFRVKFEPSGISCRGKAGQSLLEIAVDRNIFIRSDCGGKGRCGKCTVSADPADHLSPVGDSESAQLSTEQIRSGLRLACQTTPQGDVTVSVPESAREDAEGIGKTDVHGDFSCKPMVGRRVISIPSLSFSAAKAPRDFLTHVISSACDKEPAFKELSGLRAISRPECVQGEVTLVEHREKGVTAVFSGKREVSLGAAVDIGTTTLAAYLCNLRSGRILSSAAAANPQRRYGEDVISRITSANERDDGLSRQQEAVVVEINRLIGRCLEAAQAGSTDIDEVTVVGNTTMEQIFMGIHPHGLGFSPYLPVSRRSNNLRAKDMGLDLNPGTNVFVFPVISGFVGGDTLGVILWDRPHERKEVSLIVDIGTNGEVVVGNDQGLWTTSCATGPALEGAHILCGMRAAAGAVHRVRIEAGSYRVDCEVLGQEKGTRALGICGSGIIDTVAQMRKTGLLLPGGRIREGLPGVSTDEKGIGRKFVLIPGERSAAGREISIALADVRQIQLAKAALFVGIKRLMEAAGFERFDRLVLTGAFGARFDWKNAVSIGMLPEIPKKATVEVISNAAGRGAVMALLDRNRRQECIDLAGRVRFLELAEDPNFALEFAAATTFPELP